MSESAASAKRLLVYVWRETGAVRNARPSRGQAGVHPEEGAVGRRREASDASGVGSSVDC